MAGLKDVARLARVSIATASNVLRGAKPASAEVEERVRAAAAELGYVPNRQARTLRTGRSQAVGVVVPDLTNPFFPALVQALETAARASGYATLVGDARHDPDEERAALALLASYRVDGLVWVPAGAAADSARRLDEALAGLEPPVVTVDRPLPGRDSVRADHAEGGRLVAAHLAERLGGRGRIGVLSGPAGLPSAAERRRGLLEALPAGLEPAWEVEAPFRHELPPAALAALAGPPVDAVACANDAIALGAVRALRDAGRRVPDDVLVIGFDDIPWAALAEPSLTTVRQPLAELGATAFRLLRERLESPATPPRARVLAVELVARASSARPPVRPPDPRPRRRTA